MRKPNYRFERAERDRTKLAKKEEKARRRQIRLAPIQPQQIIRCASTRRDRWSPPIGNGAQLPRLRSAAIHRIALAKLTPNRRAAARQLMPSSRTAATTRVRKSTDKGPMPRRLRFGAPQESDFQGPGNSGSSQKTA